MHDNSLVLPSLFPGKSFKLHVWWEIVCMKAWQFGEKTVHLTKKKKYPTKQESLKISWIFVCKDAPSNRLKIYLGPLLLVEDDYVTTRTDKSVICGVFIITVHLVKLEFQRETLAANSMWGASFHILSLFSGLLQWNTKLYYLVSSFSN